MDTSATAPAAPAPSATSPASAEVRCTPPLTGFAAEVVAIQKRYAPAAPALTPEERAAATLLMEVGRHSQADAERIARLLAPVFLPF